VVVVAAVAAVVVVAAAVVVVDSTASDYTVSLKNAGSWHRNRINYGYLSGPG
jgi:hypothetical protein